MAFDAPITSDIADAILVWCGVESPTPAEILVAELAAKSAQDTIKQYRGLGVDDDFETALKSLAIEMGVYLFEKRGVDGTTNYSENGVQRTFEAGSFPPSTLGRIPLKVTTG